MADLDPKNEFVDVLLPPRSSNSPKLFGLKIIITVIAYESQISCRIIVLEGRMAGFDPKNKFVDVFYPLGQVIRII